MGEAGWLIVLACGFSALVGIHLGARFSKGRPDGVAIQELPPAPQVTSVIVGDDDVLIFECPYGISEFEWNKMNEFYESSIVGRFPEDLAKEKRRRAVIFPPNWNIRLLHIKRTLGTISAAPQ